MGLTLRIAAYGPNSIDFSGDRAAVSSKVCFASWGGGGGLSLGLYQGIGTVFPYHRTTLRLHWRWKESTKSVDCREQLKQLATIL